ncbi:potassium-transporting ATPase, A subunit [Methylocella silvestris BL2]|uniref:Potassium-transporting ATPase potassium-binding subunit n=1 Tax=Methylocella silvestris (strain DSM 15510 / CIP 108128 / LMG 27833 / NCIMB 13906 / BL2) TaxID=395965 RepID=B8ESF4_METSB|nr:potassium-transporting ATPase subunit KdpA [Methylocella silvestris]ACK49844.1 potassium-transporting ATPase, A subunit [Methylocella silvestris BL2]
MTVYGVLLIVILLVVLVLTIRPLGGYMAWVFAGRHTSIHPLKFIEDSLFRLTGVDPESEQNWLNYAAALIIFNLAGILLLFAFLLLQDALPLNPRGFGPMAPDLAFNTAVSFVTNTSWQAYGGETTLSYFNQMGGVAVQSFLSAATGMAVAIAMARGFARHGAETVGNAWVDITRATLYVLLPLSVIGALFLASQGAPQTFEGTVAAATLDGAVQTIARGPVASQEAIKLLGGDGGGFFNVNSAHPFENPTALTNFFEMLLIFLIGAALTNTFGRMVGDERQGWSLFGAMLILFAVGLFVVYFSEASGNPHFAALGVDQTAGPLQAGGNMEGKDVRFGIAGSALFANVTTTSADGAVNAMHDSFTPLGGGMVLANMMMDEVIVGAPGSGLFGMLLYVLVAVFVAGLMVGRTPEYLGKKIESAEVKMAVLALLVVPATILIPTALAAVLPTALAALSNAGPHGFSELLYAYTSAAATNGSAFAGLGANTPFFNLTLAAAMLSGRFLVILPVLAIAGSLAAKAKVPVSAGTLPTDGTQFIFLIVGAVVIFGMLTFFPALALGPLAEHFAGPQLY